MRYDAGPSQASRNAAGELSKPHSESRFPVSRCIERPCRCFGISGGPSLAEKPGDGIVGDPIVGLYPLEATKPRANAQ